MARGGEVQAQASLERVNAEALMTASGQSVKRLMEFGARGPRRPAQAAALRRPEAVRLPKFHGGRRHRGRCPGTERGVSQQADHFSEVPIQYPAWEVGLV